MNLCRLCFEICGQYSKIEGNLKEMLKFCINEIDLEITKGAVICKDCQEDLTRSYALKKKSLSTQRKISIIKKQWLPSAPNSTQNIIGERSGKTQDSMDLDNVVRNDNNDPVESFDQFDNRKRNLIASSPLLVHEQSRTRNIRQKINYANTIENSPLLNRTLPEESSENSSDDASIWLPNKPLYPCGRCTYTTRYKNCLKKHRPNCPLRLKRDCPDPPEFTCKICTKTCGSREIFSEHMSSEHNMVLKTFKCTYCTFRASTTETVREHESTHKKYETRKASAKKKRRKRGFLYCTFDACNKRFLSKRGWQYHLNNHYRSRSPDSAEEIRNPSTIDDEVKAKPPTEKTPITKSPEPIATDEIQIQVLNEIVQEEMNFDLPELPQFQDEDKENGCFSLNIQNEVFTNTFALQSPQSEMECFLSAESSINDKGEFTQLSSPPSVEQTPSANPETDPGSKTEQIPRGNVKATENAWNWHPDCGKILYNIGKMQPREGEIWKLNC